MNSVVKKKMGRPYLDNTKKDIMLRIRISQEELEILEKKSQKKNMSKSEYIRNLIKK